jgi:hypothetical protein
MRAEPIRLNLLRNLGDFASGRRAWGRGRGSGLTHERKARGDASIGRSAPGRRSARTDGGVDAAAPSVGDRAYNLA